MWVQVPPPVPLLAINAQFINKVIIAMEVKELLNEELVRKYNITFSAKEVSKEIDSKASEVAAKADIKGFRKGKVPSEVIKMKYKDSLKSEILDKLVNNTVQDLVKKNNLELLSRPKVDEVKFENDLSFNLELTLSPNIPELDYSQINITKNVTEVTEEDLKKAMEHFRESQREFEKLPEKTAAKAGDAVLIDAVGSIEGKEFPEGKVSDKKLILGSKEYIPGFEDGLIGSKAGDSKVLDLAFPKNYWKKDYSEKKVQFKVDVKDVFQVKTPELNDELAKKNNVKDIAELKNKIKESLQKSYDDRSNNILRKDLFDYLDKNLKFTLPQHLIENEEKIVSQNDNQAVADDKEKDKSKEKKKPNNKEIATRRVKLGLFLASIAKKENIQVTEQDIRSELGKYIESSPMYAQQIIEHYTKNPQAAEVLKNTITENKSVEFVIGKIKVQEKKVTPERLIELLEAIN